MPNITFHVLQKPIEDRIIDAACIYWNIERDYLRQKKEDSEFIYRKSIVYYLLKQNTIYSYRYIANLFGFTSHQPVMRLVTNIESSKDVYRQTKIDLAAISRISDTLKCNLLTTFIRLENLNNLPNEPI